MAICMDLCSILRAAKLHRCKRNVWNWRNNKKNNWHWLNIEEERARARHVQCAHVDPNIREKKKVSDTCQYSIYIYILNISPCSRYIQIQIFVDCRQYSPFIRKCILCVCVCASSCSTLCMHNPYSLHSIPVDGWTVTDGWRVHTAKPRNRMGWINLLISVMILLLLFVYICMCVAFCCSPHRTGVPTQGSNRKQSTFLGRPEMHQNSGQANTHRSLCIHILLVFYVDAGRKRGIYAPNIFLLLDESSANSEMNMRCR